MTILLADPRVAAVPVHETYQPLVTLGASFGPARARVRVAVAAKLCRAQVALPVGTSLRVVEGHRSATAQRSIIATYAAQVAAAHPGISQPELMRLTSRFVAPIEVAGHVAGAAIDVTLVGQVLAWRRSDKLRGRRALAGRRSDKLRRGQRGVELDLGTPIDATPEASGGRCYFAAPDIPPRARANRELLAGVLSDVGLVNYPTEWWHWSFGDRYWALLAGAEAALYGPIVDLDEPGYGRPAA